MSLKDLVVSKSELTEKQVKEIVSDYVRYDPDAKEIVFTPEAASLPYKAKVLVYLVALQGWSFVTDETIPVEGNPAQIGEVLHIGGGTLRPILKDLKDSNLVYVKGRSYSVRAAALPQISTEIGKYKEKAHPTPSPPARRRRSRRKKNEEKVEKDASGEEAKTRAVGKTAALFDKIVDEGFFGTPRTLRDVKERFHEKAHLIPVTSIPKYLLKAVREDKLGREKERIEGKEVWVYKTKG